MSCHQDENSNKSEIKYSEILFTEEVEDISEPPKNLKSDFKSLNEWLFNACKNEHPESIVDRFSFGIFESTEGYTIFFTGLKREEKGNSVITHIAFEPLNMYYPLHKTEFENLDREQVFQKIKNVLKEFTNSEKFKSSFFAQAKSIEVDYDGQIWSRENSKE